MRRLSIGPLLLLPFLSLPLLLGQDVAAGTQGEPSFEQDVLVFVEDYCLHCHEGNKAEADLDLSRHLTAEEARAEPEIYWEAAWKVWDHAMPPPRRKQQPTNQERARFLAWVDAPEGLGFQPKPALPVYRRMNRSIYRRSIRDFCGVTVPEEVLLSLPSDEAGDGFDNIGSSLTLADDAVLRYMEAAETIASLAVVPFAPDLVVQRWTGADLDAPNHSAEAAALYSRGQASVSVHVPRAGRFQLRVGSWGDQAGEESCRMAILMDGKVRKEVSVDGGIGEVTETILPLDLDQGTHQFAASFLNDYWRPDAPEGTPKDRNLYVGWIELEGPLDPLPPTEFQADLHRRFPLAAEAPGKDRAVRDLIEQLTTHAWRRPPTNGERKRYADLVAGEKTWEEVVRLAMTAILTSPNFLFEGTTRPKRFKENQEYRLTGSEIATRLSFFLWSSLPDRALREAAAEPHFATDPTAILGQVERMLADPRGLALAEDFADQCFRIRGLETHELEQDLFPEVDAALLASMQQETRMLFLDILAQDRDLRDFLHSTDTFLDRRLADHYGLAWPEGAVGWQRFDLTDTQRRGVLGHASVLTMTSFATRTSPVRRGKWILDNLLGAPPPPPPADAGLLDEGTAAAEQASLRERLAAHRTKPQCISCHTVMDPLGFSLENFDAVGRWRDHIGSLPVDAGGELPDGTKLEDLQDLTHALEARGGFERLLVKRLTSYALGRTLGPADRPTIQAILEAMDPDRPTLRQAIHAIVLSDAFLTHDSLEHAITNR